MKFKLTNTNAIIYGMGLLKLIMRTFIFMFCLTAFSLSSKDGFSQKANIIINSDKAITINEVFELIKTQTNYRLVYRPEQINDASTINVKQGAIKTDELLKLALNPIECSFKFVEKTIVIIKDSTLLNQEIFTIKGTVTDKLGAPIPGLTVYVLTVNPNKVNQPLAEYVSDFSTNVTSTDFNGNFLIEASVNQFIVVSGIGYKLFTQRVVEKIDTLSFVMQEKVSQLDEIVLTGYQSLSKERSAGSFAKADAVAIGRRNDFNILSSIETLLPGVLTSPDGQITIRGRSTINANQDPLIVVDGFPIERSIETINQNNIESVTVLKDASAASIWGVRAANGVIVIKTKRGQHAKEKGIEVDFKFTTNYRSSFDFSELPIASTAQFIEFEKFKVDNNLIFSGLFNPRLANSPIVDAYLSSAAEGNQLASSIFNINSHDEFSDLFTQAAISSQYAVNIAGKGEKSTHRASFSYDKIESEFRGNESERFTVDLFESFQLIPSLNIELGINYAINETKDNGLALSDLATLLPYQRIQDSNGNLIPQPFGFNKEDADALTAAGFPYSWDYNLLQEHRNKDNSFTNSNITSTLRLKYDILKGLNATVGYQYESANSQTENLFNENTYLVRNTVNTASNLNNGIVTSGIPQGQIFDEANANLYSHTVRGVLNYQGTIINEDHYLSAIAGGEIREIGNKFSQQRKYGYNPQTLQFANVNNADQYIDVSGNSRLLPSGSFFRKSLDRFVSYFTNVGYTFKDKYSLNGSYRIDKTNLFGRSDDFNDSSLWSVGASWQLHKEDFFKADFVDRLVLRGSYGINGNVDPSTSPFLIAEVSTSFTTGLPYAFISNPANPLLRWERTATTNFGLDFALLNNRLNGSVEYYKRVSTDLLGSSTVNSTLGFDSAFINFASLENSGVEVSLNGLIIDKSFKWKSTINFSTNANEVTKVDTPQENVGSYLDVNPLIGKPLDYLYSFSWAGLSNSGVPQVLDENGNIVDFTTDISDVAALNFEGTTIPKYHGSFINEFTLKGFSLLTNFSFRLGHKFRVPTIQYEPLLGTGNVSLLHQDWEDRWQQSGDESNTNVPAAPTSQTGVNIYDRYTSNSNNKVQSASTIRFRELLLAYKLPKQIFNTDFTLGLQVRNLALINFNDANLDPDYLYTNNNNLNERTFSPKAEYSFSVKVNF